MEWARGVGWACEKNYTPTRGPREVSANTIQLVLHQVQNQGSRQAKPYDDHGQHPDQKPSRPAAFLVARLGNSEELEECGGKVVQQGHGPMVRAPQPARFPPRILPPGEASNPLVLAARVGED